jgi:hypothetical protein
VCLYAVLLLRGFNSDMTITSTPYLEEILPLL